MACPPGSATRRYSSSYCRTIRSTVYRRVTRALASAPMRRALTGSDSSVPRPRARATGSLAGTSIPVSPSTTASVFPPTAVATTGRAAAPASITALLNPSACEGTATTSIRGRSAGTSVRSPSRWTVSEQPSSRASVSTPRRCSSEAPPTITRRAWGTSPRPCGQARTRSRCPLMGCSRPTDPTTRAPRRHPFDGADPPDGSARNARCPLHCGS